MTLTKRILWWAHSGSDYSRNGVIRRALSDAGYAIVDFRPHVSAFADWEAALARVAMPDLVWVPCFRQRDVLAAARWARRKGVPLVFDPLISAYDKQVDEFGKMPEDSRRARRLLAWERKVFSEADIVIADTKLHAQYFHERLGVPEGKLKVVYVGAEPNFFPQRTPHTGFEVLFYGSFLPLQGPDTIVAAAKLAQDLPIKWTFIGGGPLLKKCKQAAAGYANIRFEERIPYAELPGRICAADILLGVFGTTPKAGRVMPNKFFQAIACGRPIVTRESAAYPNAVKSSVAVKFIPAGDPAALCAAIRTWYADRVALANATAAARPLYEREFGDAVVRAQVDSAAGGYSALDDVDWVSCDVFDTAVFRDVARPRDVFFLLERMLGIPGFALMRKHAAREAKAASAARGEYTLADVYDRLPVSADMNRELELELAMVRPNPEVQTFLCQARSRGKKIAFTTDMYLPKETIAAMLGKCGYEYDVLLVSSEDGRTKAKGSRFVYDFLGCSNDRVLHVGDKLKADVQRPRERGVRSARYSPTPETYWTNVGRVYVGPLLVSFSKWLRAEFDRRKIDKVFFLSRDGEVMMKVYRQLFPDDLRVSYLVTSRYLAENGACADAYKAYLGNHDFSGRCAVVDVGRRGTIQRALQRLVPTAEVEGFYVDLRTQDVAMHGFFEDVSRCFHRALDALDFLFISQNNKAIAVAKNAGTFVFEYLPADADEARRHEIARWLQAGAEDFARKHVQSGMPPVLFAHDYLLHNLKQFTDVRWEDVPYLSGVKVPFGRRNEKGRYLVVPRWPMSEILRHPLRCLNAWRKRILKRK